MGFALLAAGAAAARTDPFDICVPAPPLYAAAAEKNVYVDTPDGRIAGTLAGHADAPPLSEGPVTSALRLSVSEGANASSPAVRLASPVLT